MLMNQIINEKTEVIEAFLCVQVGRQGYSLSPLELNIVIEVPAIRHKKKNCRDLNWTTKSFTIGKG